MMNTVNRNDEPLVSVVIPTYGRADLLFRSIESVLNQTYHNIEIIVVDDNGEGTEDQRNTEKTVKLFNDERLIYILHKEHRNGSVARNTGINHAKGKYICFLDDDDLFLPEKTVYQVKAISNHKLCICGFIKKSQTTSVVTGYSSCGNILNDVLFYKKDFCSGSTLMIDRECCIAIGGFDETLPRHQDYNFLAHASERYDAVLIEQPLVEITIHDRSYKPTDFKLIEQNVLKYIHSIRNILDKLDKHEKKKVIRENYYIILKKALLNKKAFNILKYAVLYNKPIELLQRLLLDINRKKN